MRENFNRLVDDSVVHLEVDVDAGEYKEEKDNLEDDQHCQEQRDQHG